MLSRYLRRAAPAALAAGSAFAAYVTYPAMSESAKPEPGLDPKQWKALKLTAVTPISSNIAVYRFAFEQVDAVSGMTVASCLLTKASIGKEKDDGTRANVMRPYTPISRPDMVGAIELAVKSYPEGKMSKHFASLKVGDTLDFKGPIVKLPYVANSHERIGMVAGGTGIAPMLQVVDEILDNSADKTKVSLIFANVSETDILLKDTIDARAKAHPDRLDVYYVVDKQSSPDWNGGVGYIRPAMLTERMPPPSANAMMYVCGPPPMVKVVCGPKDGKEQGELGGMLQALGYEREKVFKF